MDRRRWLRWGLCWSLGLLLATGILNVGEPLSAVTADNEDPASEIVDRVVGGAPVEVGGHPYVVSLVTYKGLKYGLYENWASCTGTVVAPNWVLTAAHCVEGRVSDSSVEITFGSIDRTLGTTVRADQVVEAPQFWSDTRNTQPPNLVVYQFAVAGDLALVHTPTPLGDPVEMAASAYEPDWDGRQTGTILGWGDTSAGEAATYPDVLHAGSITLAADQDCARVFGEDFMIGAELCTAIAAGRSACAGDSGGPVLAADSRGRTVLVGVISTGDGGCTGPSDYTRVSAHRGWIDQTIGAGQHASGDGYWLFNEAGHVRAFGGAVHQFNLLTWETGGWLVDVAALPERDGYWSLSAGGRIEGYGNLPWIPDGSDDYAGGWYLHLEHSWWYNPITDTYKPPTDELYTSIAVTPTGEGLWLFTNQGRVITLGDTQPFPANGQAGAPTDLTHLELNGPIIDAAATPTGNGYYLVGSDGGVFTFGDAQFAGSMGGHDLNQPIVGLVPDPDNDGYWLVASDGGVFAFNADFRGSLGSIPLNQPIVGMVPHGNGYLMVGSDGGAFNFSNLPFYGSTGNNPSPHPVFAIASSTTT
ncbi:MAG: serine protease [Actinomycetia bacterium]|nr:serine protease [Actinomycetes bacterium]